MKLTPWQKRGRVFLKRFMYSQLYLRDAFMQILGREKPLVKFKVEADPPSIYFNFELDPERVPHLAQELDLPFPLARIRCLEGEEPFYCITLNIYRVSGLVNGLRAEWSIYIEDDEGVPRYLVVDAQSDVRSLDSVHLLTDPGDVTHAHNAGSLDSTAVAEDGGRFESSLSPLDSGPLVAPHAEWIEANDYIYWLSGVCDRTFYDSGMARPRARLVETGNVKIADSTRWGAMALPEPRHVILYENAIEFAMSPWWNIDDVKA